MTREEREQALEWFKNRPITMPGAKKMYDLAISALEQPEPCEDTISRQAAIDVADAVWSVTGDKNVAKVWDRIKELSPAQPERMRGKWEEKAISDEKVIDEWQSARCSACGKYHTAPYMYYFNNYNYCPNCGTRMTEEDV